MRYRSDIQGLRAVAVLLVIFAHVGIAGFAGGWIGVDVFFVISGFLITGLLIRENKRTNHVSLVQFYLRRAKRILPAALVTIIVVLIASNVLLNSIRTAAIRTDALWSLGFASNINLIRQSTDYFASTAVSPLQHYWSLAVEEQFYLIWPALFLVIASQKRLRIQGRSFKRSSRLLVVVGVISALSLLWSISYSYSHPAVAYFSTLTRIWELGFGVLLAIVTKRSTSPLASWSERDQRIARAAASWTGLAAILAGACLIIKPGDPFPGYLALIPILGAIGVIFGGLTEDQPLPNRLLSKQPLGFIGAISFSLYLWHWPVHVFAQDLYPDSADSALGKIVQLVVIAAISVASYYAIENPARRIPIGNKELTRRKSSEISRTPRGAIAVMCAGAALLFIVGTAASGGNVDSAESAGGIGRPITTPITTQPSATTLPSSPTPRTTDGPLLQEWKQHIVDAVSQANVSDEVLRSIEATAGRRDNVPCTSKASVGCFIGTGSDTISILGDSHAQVLKPMLRSAFPSWRIHDYNTANCGWSTIDFPNPAQVKGAVAMSASQCADHRDASLAETISEQPRIVVLAEDSQWIAAQSVEKQTQWAIGMATTLDRLQELLPNTVIVVFGEVPRIISFETCLRGDSVATCATKPETSEQLRTTQRRAVEAHPGVLFIDSATWLCTFTVCPPVIDDTPAYSDGHHLSAPLTTKLGPIFKEFVGL